MRTLEMRWGTPVFLALSFVYLFLTLFLASGTPIFFENDHFLQMYDSVRMLNGELLYGDFFQFTFPGTEVWYLILFSIFGQKLWLLNATILLLGLSLTWTILAMSRRLMNGVYVYIAPTLFLFFGFRWFGMDGGHRLFSCLFASLAILILLETVNWKRLVAAGVLAAMSAFFTQTRGLAVFAGIGIFLIWYYITLGSTERVRGFAAPSLAFGFAFSLSLFGLLGYFLFTVGVGNFFESTILFGQSYTADPVNNSNLYFQFWKQLVGGNFDLISLPVNLFYYILVPAVYVSPPLYYLVKRPANRELLEQGHAALLRRTDDVSGDDGIECGAALPCSDTWAGFGRLLVVEPKISGCFPGGNRCGRNFCNSSLCVGTAEALSRPARNADGNSGVPVGNCGRKISIRQ